MAESPRLVSPLRRVALPLAIVLLGYALRAYRVAVPAFRGDEAFSIGFSAQALGAMFEAMARTEPNPPVYWLLLHAWVPLAGTGELAVRWPSVLAGALTVALAYRLGRTLLGRPAANFGALFVAVNPLLIWHAQDARAYALLAALVAAAVWMTWRAAVENRLRHWAAAAVLWPMALFAHYFSAVPLALTGLAFLLAPKTRPRWPQGLALSTSIGLVFTPWLVYVGRLLAGQSRGWIRPVGLGAGAWRALTEFSVGVDGAGATLALRLIGGCLLGMLIALSVATAAKRRSSETIWVLSIALGTPLAMWLVSLSRPFFTEQYMIGAVPFVLLAAAHGAQRLARVRPPGGWLAGAGVAGLTLAGLMSLQNYFFDPAFSKSPNWRGVMAYLDETGRPSEVVVWNLPDPAFYHYYRGPMPVEASPPGPIAEVGTEATVAQLERLRDNFEHIRFFFTPGAGYDPEAFVGQWLDACCEKTSDAFVYGFRVQAFDTPAGSLAARQDYPAEFDDGVRLTGYRVLDSSLRPGDSIHLTLYWSADEAVEASYTVFTHLLAPDGFNVVGADGLPGGGMRPTDRWTPGQPVIDTHWIPVPADIPPGRYSLDIGLYSASTGARLNARLPSGSAADHLTLPVAIEIVP